MTRARVEQQPDLGANHEGRDSYLSVRTLSREARKLCDELDLHISGSRMRRVLRRFVDEGRSDVDLRTYLLSYADPTGELACEHVLRELYDS